MNAELSIPPLRDLPPGRLAVRAQHLRTALEVERSRSGRRPRLGIPRLQLAVVAVLALALTALVLVPVGGASLGSRAIDSISSVWRSGERPDSSFLANPVQDTSFLVNPIPPYHSGDQVWRTNDAVPPPGKMLPFVAPDPVALEVILTPADRPYRPGDKVWTTEPPQDRIAITISCPTGTIDAARKLRQLQREGSLISEVNCR